LYENGKWDYESSNLIPQWKNELSSVFNRDFDTGFYYRTPKDTSFDNKATYKKLTLDK